MIKQVHVAAQAKVAVGILLLLQCYAVVGTKPETSLARRLMGKSLFSRYVSKGNAKWVESKHKKLDEAFKEMEQEFKKGQKCNFTKVNEMVKHALGKITKYEKQVPEVTTGSGKKKSRWSQQTSANPKWSDHRTKMISMQAKAQPRAAASWAIKHKMHARSKLSKNAASSSKMRELREIPSNRSMKPLPKTGLCWWTEGGQHKRVLVNVLGTTAGNPDYFDTMTYSTSDKESIYKTVLKSEVGEQATDVEIDNADQ